MLSNAYFSPLTIESLENDVDEEQYVCSDKSHAIVLSWKLPSNDNTGIPKLKAKLTEAVSHLKHRTIQLRDTPSCLWKYLFQSDLFEVSYSTDTKSTSHKLQVKMLSIDLSSLPVWWKWINIIATNSDAVYRSSVC